MDHSDVCHLKCHLNKIDLRQKRKEEREKEKAYKRANLTHIQKVLNRQSEYWTNRP